jgi:hypothetical protein
VVRSYRDAGMRPCIPCVSVSDDNFTNIIELVPVFVERVHVPIQWLGLQVGPTGDGHIQGFGGEEGVFVEQIAGVIVRLVGKKSAAESIEISFHHQNVNSKMTR